MDDEEGHKSDPMGMHKTGNRERERDVAEASMQNNVTSSPIVTNKTRAFILIGCGSVRTFA